MLLVSEEALESSITSPLSCDFQTQSLKSLREQLLIITPEIVYVILSHSRLLDCPGKRKQELDKQEAYILSPSLAENLSLSFSEGAPEACDRESFGWRERMNKLFYSMS